MPSSKLNRRTSSNRSKKLNYKRSTGKVRRSTGKVRRSHSNRRAQSLTKKNLKPTFENIFRNNQIQRLLDEINKHKNKIIKLKEKKEKIKSQKLTKRPNDPKPASIFGISSNTFGSFNEIRKLDEDEEIIQIREEIEKEKDSIRKKRERVGIIIDEKLNYVKPTSRTNISPFPVEHPVNNTAIKMKLADLPQPGKTVAF